MAAERTGVLFAVFGLFLTACAGPQPIDPANVPPVYKIRNSPLPVPDPKWKPKRNQTVQAKSVSQPRQTANRPVRSTARVTSNNQRHVVRKGDTLYSLSRHYGVPLRSLISGNKLKKPYTLTVGQRLLVPAVKVHTVRKGETGYSISRAYGVTVSALMRSNRIAPPYKLAVGQTLKLPGGASYNSAQITARPSTNTASRPAKKGRTVAMPAPPPRSRAGFEWPVTGKLASRFGPKEGGLHNDGINILAATGTPVKVADAGVVVYASNALEGYGNLLLVKHSGGWITAYAHTERILVRPGQKVKRGDIVARVGATGGVTSPQLHFEIRKGRQALNPIRYLPGTKAARS